MRKGLIITLLALGLLVTGALAEATRIPLTGERNQLEILSQRGDALHFRADIGSLEALEVSTREGVFTRLSIPGFHFSKTVGAPELPQMNRLYEIPFGASTRVEIISTESQRVKLSDYGFDARIMPAQPSMPKSADPAEWPFVYDRDSYSIDRVAQPLVETESKGRLRAVDLGLMKLSPVEYLPASGEIEVTTKVEFVLHFDGADYAADAELKANTYSPFFEPIYQQVAGYRTNHYDHPDLVRDVVTMVVLTPPEFEAAMQPFVDWKTERGFNVIVGVKGDPEVGSTTSSIAAYIEDLYDNGTPTSPAPSFVVFVGDVAQMPTYQVSGDPTDRPYCDIEGDLVPDIYYGRLSATNTTQLNNILEKTLMYDQFTMPDPSYLGEVVMIAGMDSSHGYTWGNGQINYGTTYYFNAAHGIESHTYLYPGSGSSESQIIANLNDGVSYINYTAHGDVTYWYDPYISQSNVNSLTNYGEYCTAVGNCCLTSTYDYGECFAETWLRAADKGAIGYIGGSNSTYWDEDYYWGVGDGPVVTNPTYETHGLGAYDGIFHDHGEAMDQWYVCNDAIIFSGNLAVMESGSYQTTYYWNIYNLMGDPSISTYMGVPGSNPVAHEDNIEDDATSFTVAAAAGSYVGLSQDGDLVGAGSIGASGTADIAVWNLNAGGGDVQIVVMAQNYEPYITTISMGPSAQPEIAVAPGFFDVTLYQGGAATETLEISNVGEANSLLEYSISISGHADWLDIPVTSGTVGEGDTDYLNVNFSASGLGVGDYSVNIQIAHNGTDGTVFVPVDLHVETGGTDAEEIPAIMLLRGNYPNPFNPKTTIQFSLPESGMVNLVVFDVKGQKVATLADGMLDAGDHHIVWEGLNDANEPVPSGLYFYTLDTGSGKATRKMLMLK